MRYRNISIGADIELLLQHKETKEFVSAEPYIQGTKKNPYNFDTRSKYFAVSLDNVMAEFCIPPVTNKEDFYKYIMTSVDYINSVIPKEYCTVAQPSAIFDPKYLLTRNAKTFGCEPDYNAYTGYENVKPAADNPYLRSAGGHIHIGFDGAPRFSRRSYKGMPPHTELIKALDLFVGIPSVIQEPENLRKQLYGKAGAFRPKVYGVEYRTVSNYYLASEQLIHWMYESVDKAITFLNEGGEIDRGLAHTVEETINTNNAEQALALMDIFNIKLAA